jgi:hypothetical protein
MITIIQIKSRNTLHHMKNVKTDSRHRKINWATFAYNCKEKRKNTKLFKEMQIKIAFRAQNAVQNIV